MNIFFLIGSDLPYCIAKKRSYRTGLGPHVLSETSRHRPPTALNLARAPRSVERTPSKFGHDACPVRRGLVAAVKCCVRKARFFRCPGRLWNRTREARALCGFQHHKGENLCYFLFSDPINVGLRPTIIVPENRKQVGFPFIVLKPAGSAVGSDGPFLFAAYTR